MKRIVVGFSYVDYKNARRKIVQESAITVLSRCPKNVFPISFGFKHSGDIKLLTDLNIPQLNILNRDSSITINNNRRLPYIKEILNYCNKIDCDVFGYINSDILVAHSVYGILSTGLDAYSLSRSDIQEISSDDFLNTKGIKVIYGGDKHIGADGFFFDRVWWNSNKDLFPDDLIIGETEWDTCYRKVIENSKCKSLEARLLYHVYHDAKWDIRSPGGINNRKILKTLCQ